MLVFAYNPDLSFHPSGRFKSEEHVLPSFPAENKVAESACAQEYQSLLMKGLCSGLLDYDIVIIV